MSSQNDPLPKKHDKAEHRIVKKGEVGKQVIAEHKKAVVAEKESKKVLMSAPPAPPVKIGDVVNPLIGTRGLKRAMAVAIVKKCLSGDGKLDENKAGLMIRASGILYKSGWAKEAETDPLAQNEWSGKGYCRFVTNTTEGKVYHEKQKDKFDKCIPFAKALYDEVAEETKKEKEVVAAAPAVAATK